MKPSKLVLSAAVAALLTAGGALAAPMDPPKVSAGDTLIPFDVNEGTSMAVSLSPDGKQAVIDLQGSLWVLPAGGGRAVRITDLFNDARQPVWSPDGQTIAYFAYRDGGYDLWSIKPDGTEQKKLSTGTFDDRDPSWSPDGSKLAFASDRGEPGKASYNIWTLELATGKLEQVSFSPFENRLPTWSPDGKSIAYSSSREGFSGLFSVTLGARDEKELRRSTGTLSAPSYGPAGQLAYVLLDGGQSRLEIDGKAVSGKENVFAFRASWLTGKGGFAYVSDGKIRRRSDVGGALKQVPFEAALAVAKPSYEHAKRDFDSAAARKALGIVRPAISPDGKSFAFIALGDLYTAPVDGSAAPVNQTKDAFLDTDPAWSPDGKSIVYSSDKGGGLPQLWIRDLASGADRQLTKMDLQPLEAVWSPDGTKIAYIDVDGMWGVAGVGYVEVATGAAKRLTGSLGQPGRPSWSGDSRSIAIPLSLPYSKSFREGTNQIYVIPIDGSPPKWQVPVPNLSIDTRGGGGPVWSPDGARMAAIYEGTLRVWPVDKAGAPLGPPRSLTAELAHSPSWAGDSRTLLYQSNDKLRTVDAETGVITDVPLNLTYTYAKPSGVTVLHVGKLVDSITDKTQTDMDIVIDGNRIAQVRPHGVAYPAGAKVVEAPNLTAMPGLIEFHAHTQKDFGANVEKAWLAFGITTVRDPGNQPYHGVEDREASESGVRLSPRIYTTGNLMEWQRVYYKMGVAISGPAELDMELNRAKALKFDMVKSYVRMPDLQQRHIVDFAHNQMGVPVSTHEVYPASFVGVDGTEHLGATSRRGYSPKQGPLARTYSDVIQLFGKGQRQLTPTNFGVLGPYLDAHPALRNDPRIDLYPGWAQQTVKRPNPPATAAANAMRDGNNAAIKAYYAAGTKIVAGTDTQIAINLHAEIASYVEAGLTPFQALQTATKTPAELLGLDAGVIAAGKLADIALVEGDPRADIANTVNVRTVVTNGRVIAVSDLAPRK